MRVALILSLLLFSANTFADSSIYVYKEADGAVRFTTKKPAAKFNAKVYRGKSGSYSQYKSGSVRYSLSPSVYKYKSRKNSLYSNKYDSIIDSASSRYSISENLVKAVIHVESAFNPRAVSPKGARGLMQLMPFNLKKYGVTDPFSPNQNIYAGTKMLSRLINKYSGNLVHALAAYNAGEGAVKKYRGVPPYRETQNYVRKVLKYKKLYANV